MAKKEQIINRLVKDIDPFIRFITVRNPDCWGSMPGIKDQTRFNNLKWQYIYHPLIRLHLKYIDRGKSFREGSKGNWGR